MKFESSCLWEFPFYFKNRTQCKHSIEHVRERTHTQNTSFTDHLKISGKKCWHAQFYLKISVAGTKYFWWIIILRHMAWGTRRPFPEPPNAYQNKGRGEDRKERSAHHAHPVAESLRSDHHSNQSNIRRSHGKILPSLIQITIFIAATFKTFCCYWARTHNANGRIPTQRNIPVVPTNSEIICRDGPYE